MARPRSQEAHERVLLTALDLFGTRGIDATSMDAVAHASGVSKATIYNHWANKEALLLDVMLMLHGLNRDAEEVDTGDICRDLATVLSRRPPDQFDAARDRMMPALPAFLRRLRAPAYNRPGYPDIRTYRFDPVVTSASVVLRAQSRKASRTFFHAGWRGHGFASEHFGRPKTQRLVEGSLSTAWSKSRNVIRVAGRASMKPPPRPLLPCRNPSLTRRRRTFER